MLWRYALCMLSYQKILVSKLPDTFCYLTLRSIELKHLKAKNIKKLIVKS